MLSTSQAVYDFIATGAVEIAFDLSEEFSAVKDLALRYQNVPMSLADACLVRMSEITLTARFSRLTAISESTAKISIKLFRLLSLTEFSKLKPTSLYIFQNDLRRVVSAGSEDSAAGMG